MPTVRIHRAERHERADPEGPGGRPTREEVSAYLRKNRMILVSVREAPKKINLSFGKGGSRPGTS